MYFTVTQSLRGETERCGSFLKGNFIVSEVLRSSILIIFSNEGK